MGCIHVDLGGPFKTTEPEPKEYKTIHVEGFPLKHVFYTEEDPDTENSETQPFYLPAGTEWVNITIKIEINNYGYINNSPINISFIEQYVKIKITDPDKKTYFEKTYIETYDGLTSLDEPDKGTWIVWVEAKGFGNQNIHDNYVIDAISHQPV
jgi:hypothetical protein